jgi:hypothetical protein
VNETDLLHAFCAAAVQRDPSLRLFRRNVMTGKTAGGQYVRAGIKGQADIYGFLRGSPAVPIEIELKAATGRTSEEQKRWGAFCNTWGVVYLLLAAERGENPNETIERWIATLSTTLQPLRKTA